MKNKNKKGFTLIELIVIMAVIGILVLLAIPKFMGFTEKARLTELKSNAKQLENASERYYINKESWPRLDTSYTADQVKGFAEKIYDSTGAIITLDPEGNYYDIDYNALNKYINVPRDKENYILQNPVGNVYVLDGLLESAKNRLNDNINIVENINRMSLGGNHVTFLKENGEVYVGGSNSNGQLGDGTVVDKSTPIKINIDNNKIISISNGYLHSVALTEDGKVYTWGYNSYGELGDLLRNGTNRYYPTSVNINNSLINKVYAGTYRTFAITELGEVYGWGYNNNGQLGDSTKTNRSTPTKIDINGEKIKDITTGGWHTIFLTENGEIYASGTNGFGELGDGTNINKETPTKITLNKTVKKITAGWYYTLFLTEDGEVYSSGTNSLGQLGDGTNVNKSIPTKIDIDGKKIKYIATGPYHSFAITETGELYAWGQNTYGQLGDGTKTHKKTPVKINIDEKIVWVGASYASSLAISESGNIYGWGNNGHGIFCNGTTTSSSIPVKIDFKIQ